MVAVFAMPSPVRYARRFRSRSSIKAGLPLNNDRSCDHQSKKKIGSSADGTSHSRKIELLSIGYQTACSVEAGAQGLSVTVTAEVGRSSYIYRNSLAQLRGDGVKSICSIRCIFELAFLYGLKS
jgi:hypothetical protein